MTVPTENILIQNIDPRLLQYVEDLIQRFPLNMRYKVEVSNSCGAGLLPARYVPHNIENCCIVFYVNIINQEELYEHKQC